MNIAEILSEIDAEILRLQQAKAILSGTSTKKGPGRPRGSVNTPKKVVAKSNTPRKMSAAGRARIAAAQKARWAKLKKGR